MNTKISIAYSTGEHQEFVVSDAMEATIRTGEPFTIHAARPRGGEYPVGASAPTMDHITRVIRSKIYDIKGRNRSPKEVIVPQPLVRGLVRELAATKPYQYLLFKSDSDLVDYINEKEVLIFSVPVRATHDKGYTIEVTEHDH